MRSLVVALAPPLLYACTCQSKKADTKDPAASSTPRVAISQQPWYLAPASAIPGAGTPRVAASAGGPADEAGARIGKALPKDCTDQKCRFATCNKSCAAWVSETAASTATANQKNDQYFKCLGGCFDASGDAGSP